MKIYGFYERFWGKLVEVAALLAVNKHLDG